MLISTAFVLSNSIFFSTHTGGPCPHPAYPDQNLLAKFSVAGLDNMLRKYTRVLLSAAILFAARIPLRLRRLLTSLNLTLVIN